MDLVNKPVDKAEMERTEKAEKIVAAERPAVPRGQAPAPKTGQDSQSTGPQPFGPGDKVARELKEEIMKKAAQVLIALPTVNPLKELSMKFKIPEKKLARIMQAMNEYGIKEKETIYILDLITEYKTDIGIVLKLMDENYDLSEIASILETRRILAEEYNIPGRMGKFYYDSISIDLIVEFDKEFGGGEFEMTGTMRLLEMLCDAAPDRPLSRLIKDAIELKSTREDVQSLDKVCRILKTRRGYCNGDLDMEPIEVKQERIMDPVQEPFEENELLE